jgi:hypothetical protein
MFKAKWILLLAFLCPLFMTGCGSGGSDTSGTLTLTVSPPQDTTGGQFNVLATAVYTPAPSSTNTAFPATEPQGVPIMVSMAVHTLNGTPVTITKKLFTDSSGTVTLSENIGQTSEVTYVDVTATTGGLSQSKTVAIPAL